MTSSGVSLSTPLLSVPDSVGPTSSTLSTTAAASSSPAVSQTHTAVPSAVSSSATFISSSSTSARSLSGSLNASASSSPSSVSVLPSSSLGTGRSTVVPGAPVASPSSSDTFPDQPLSSTASSRASAASGSSLHTSGPSKATAIKSHSTTLRMAGQQAPTGMTSVDDTSASSEAPSTAPSATSQAPSSTTSKAIPGGQDPAPPSATSESTTDPPLPSSTDSGSSTSAALTSADSVSVTKPDSTRVIESTSRVSPDPPSPTSINGPGSTSAPVQGVSSSSVPLTDSPGHTRSFPEIPLPPPASTSVPVVPSSSPTDATSTRIIVARPPADTFPATVVTFPSQPDLTLVPQTHEVSQAATAGDASTAVLHSAIPIPAATPSPDSSASSEHDSEGASGIKQANEKSPSPTPESTSTVTDKPETTLSKPVFFTVTDSEHHTSVSVPPVFTSVGVSTQSNGVLVSVTHVIANPTGIWSVSGASSQSGFFADTKAVAGVFLAIGIVITAIGLSHCFFLRRRQRRNPRWISTISRPLPMPDNPFEDPRDLSPPPQMRYASGYTDRTLVIAGGEGSRLGGSALGDDTERTAQGSVSHHSDERLVGLGLAGIGANGRRMSAGGARASLESPSRRPSGSSSVGLAVTSDHRVDASSHRHHRPEPTSASARSSPSLYPPTLPALPGDDNRSLVDIPLENENENEGVSRRTSNASATRVSSPTTRKPVPTHAEIPELEPRAPAPLTPQQQRAQQARPPVVPPRSPLRRNSTAATTASRSPPPTLSSIQTQLHTSVQKAYEPLTPPASFASISPAGSSSGHESLPPPVPPPPSPGSISASSSSGSSGSGSVSASAPVQTAKSANPFSDAHEVRSTGIPSFYAHPRRRETFYSKAGGQQRRPSVEWKNSSPQ